MGEGAKIEVTTTPMVRNRLVGFGGIIWAPESHKTRQGSPIFSLSGGRRRLFGHHAALLRRHRFPQVRQGVFARLFF